VVRVQISRVVQQATWLQYIRGISYREPKRKERKEKTHHICQADELINGDYHIRDEIFLYPSVKADLFSPTWVDSP
jgi:hypothetical protein